MLESSSVIHRALMLHHVISVCHETAVQFFVFSVSAAWALSNRFLVCLHIYNRSAFLTSPSLLSLSVRQTESPHRASNFLHAVPNKQSWNQTHLWTDRFVLFLQHNKIKWSDVLFCSCNQTINAAPPVNTDSRNMSEEIRTTSWLYVAIYLSY